jgi:hypothetical protein
MATKTKSTTTLGEKLNGSQPHPNGTHKVVKGSFYEKNKHLMGSLSSGVTDLSSNKEYMKGFGRSRNADNR